MGTKDDCDIPEEWLHQSSPMEVLQQLSQEALRMAGEAWHGSSPGSPTFSAANPGPAPGHRRAQSEIVTSSQTNDSDGNFSKWKSQMQRALQWGSRSFSEDNRYSSFDPEILANQKRQWYQLNSKTGESGKYNDPTSLFEHFIIVGIRADAKLDVVENAFARRKRWELEMGASDMYNFLRPTFPTLEPEILFMYPPGKKLALRLKDLAAFCFPEGVKTHVMERTPSFSELNELVYGQEHLRRDDLSFIFSLKVANNATLYGVCLHVQEVVQRPPAIYGSLSPLSQSQAAHSRFLVSAPRCYCILTRAPFFELHYAMLNSIISQERLTRITKFATAMALVDNAPSQCVSKNHKKENLDSRGNRSVPDWMDSAIPVEKAVTLAAAAAGIISEEEAYARCEICSSSSATSDHIQIRESGKDGHENYDGSTSRDQSPECRSFESLFSPATSMASEEDGEICYTQDEDFRVDIIMEWAKENKNDLVQIICGYHCMRIPERGSRIIFQPLEHLQAIEYQRAPLSVLGLSEEYLTLKDSEETPQVKLKLDNAEEAVTLSLWSTATTCRVLSLDSVLALVTGVLLEKQVIVQCPNLGVLSAVVSSLIPIIRPFEWQSLLLPVLPGKMIDFLDAPVPFLVGIQHKPADMKVKASNLVRVDVLKNKVKCCNLPHLPRHNELVSELRPIHSILSCEDSIAQKNPVYRCNVVQAEAAAHFLVVMRQYLNSLCSGLRSHTITSIQSNDKVCILLKDSFIDSFPRRDQPFFKLFVETQLFSVYSDSILSSYENEKW